MREVKVTLDGAITEYDRRSIVATHASVAPAPAAATP
jgi:hypothetical protein